MKRASEIARESLERIKAMPRPEPEPARDMSDDRRYMVEQSFRHVFPARWLGIEPTEPLERGLYLSGNVGTGKTHVAVGHAKATGLLRGSTPMWCSTPLWLAETRASYNGGEAAKDYRDFIRTRLLVIDDLGVEKGSEWAQESIYCLIEAAYESETLCIITSNLSLSDLSRRLGARIASRIAEMCDIRRMDGGDRRVSMARGAS